MVGNEQNGDRKPVLGQYGKVSSEGCGKKKKEQKQKTKSNVNDKPRAEEPNWRFSVET